MKNVPDKQLQRKGINYQAGSLKFHQINDSEPWRAMQALSIWIVISNQLSILLKKESQKNCNYLLPKIDKYKTNLDIFELDQIQSFEIIILKNIF